MKRAIISMLSAVGLVPARRYEALSRRCEALSHRSESLSRRIEETNRNLDAWKKRAVKGARRERTLEEHSRELEKRLQKQVRRNEFLRAAIGSATGQIGESMVRPDVEVAARPDVELAARGDELAARPDLELTARPDVELLAMQAQLADALRALAVTREHLMAIEVKLEILEGAANVLDARTRAQVIGSTAG